MGATVVTYNLYRGDSVEKPSIFEYYLNDKTSTEMPIDGIGKGSALCAYYAGDRRHCIFEGRHGVLMEFDGYQSGTVEFF